MTGNRDSEHLKILRENIRAEMEKLRHDPEFIEVFDFEEGFKIFKMLDDTNEVIDATLTDPDPGLLNLRRTRAALKALDLYNQARLATTNERIEKAIGAGEPEELDCPTCRGLERCKRKHADLKARLEQSREDIPLGLYVEIINLIDAWFEDPHCEGHHKITAAVRELRDYLRKEMKDVLADILKEGLEHTHPGANVSVNFLDMNDVPPEVREKLKEFVARQKNSRKDRQD